jgi:hypothetical protein
LSKSVCVSSVSGSVVGSRFCMISNISKSKVVRRAIDEKDGREDGMARERNKRSICHAE